MMKRVLLSVCMLGVVAMAANETEILFPSLKAPKWDPARDANRLKRELSEHLLEESPSGLHWRFATRENRYNDIFQRQEIRARFTEIRLRARNNGPSFSLALKVKDAKGAEWTVPSVPFASKEENVYRFPIDKWNVASWSKDANGILDFPLAYVTVIAFDIKPGTTYDMQVQELAVIRPEPPVATIHSISVSPQLRAGETTPLSLEFSLDRPSLEDFAAVDVHAAGQKRFRFPLALSKPLSKLSPGERVKLDAVSLEVPLFAFGGAASLTLRLGNAHLERDGKRVDEELVPVEIISRKVGTVTSHVRRHGGVPTLFINGKPHSGFAEAAYRPNSSDFRDFTEAGVGLFTICGTPTESGYGLSKTAWKAPGVYDFSQLDERVQMILKENPDAFIFPRLYLHAPRWWSAEHPDELVLFDPGDGEIKPFLHSRGEPTPSWASKVWRKDTIEGLRQLIHHVEASPYADRIIGYHLASGSTEEWMMWGANERQWVGYSPANTAYFREWLEKRYGSNQKLQAAWNDPNVTFATARVPSRRQREFATGSLRDVKTDRASVDFYLYHSFLVADTIRTFARATKEIAGRDKIVGVFYGYLLQLCGGQRQQNAGHLALGEVLASPDIDFLCSPTSYSFRQLGGEGTSHFMSLLESVKLHGKLWFNENDIRTSLAPGKIGSWGKPDTVAKDILQQEKELANALTNGAAQWWFDVGANRYDDPELMKCIARSVANGSAVLASDRSPVDQIALAVDEKSLCRLRVGDRLGRHLLVGHLPQLQRCGAPVGHYLTSDLDAFDRQRLILLPTSFAADARQQADLDKLKRDGRVLFFLYAPGVYRGDDIDPGAAEAFCGIRLKKLPGKHRLRVKLSSGETYGAAEETSPVFVADDPGAEVLGTLPDGSPGLVVKRFPDWTAVFSAAPLPPATLLRGFADQAGVHSYTDPGDVVWASQDLLAVCVAKGGSRRIRLPRKVSEVVDLHSGKSIARNTNGFSTDFADCATRLFLLRPMNKE